MKASDLTVSLQTKNFVRKLKAISKHAKALAEELELIDKETCPNCADDLDIEKIYANGEIYQEIKVCKSCGEQW